MVGARNHGPATSDRSWNYARRSTCFGKSDSPATEAVLASGVRLSGCTVHFANDEYDHGPIILQGSLPVLDDDTPETLAARVQVVECDLYPEAVRLCAAGRRGVASAYGGGEVVRGPIDGHERVKTLHCASS